MRFAEQSAQALGDMKSLVTEIRSLTSSSLDQQKTFSSKMLESILERGPYGAVETPRPGGDEVQELVREELRSVESRIASEVEDRVRELVGPAASMSELESALGDIRQEIAQLTVSAAETVSSSFLPPLLSGTLREWRDYPAFYLLLHPIVDGAAGTLEDLEAPYEDWGIAAGRKSGLGDLRKRGILLESENELTVHEAYLQPLRIWFAANAEAIQGLKDRYLKDPHENLRGAREEIDALVF